MKDFRNCLLHRSKVAVQIIAEEIRCKQNLKLNPALRYHLHQRHSVFIRKELYGVETISGKIWEGWDPLAVGSENRADVRLSILLKQQGKAKTPFRSQVPRKFSPQHTVQATSLKTISERPHQA